MRLVSCLCDWAAGRGAAGYLVALGVVLSTRSWAVGADARRSSSLISVPQRSGSSRKGAWRPGMTSICALGMSIAARRPIPGRRRDPRLPRS